MNDDIKIKLKRMLRLLTVVVFLLLAVFFLTSFRLENCYISPGSYYSESEIRDRIFTRGTDTFTVLFYWRYRLFGLDEIPFVEDIDVEYIDKNSLRIYVYDKNMIGCVQVMEKYMYFDREGIVVECQDTRLAGLPEIRGVEFSKLVMYSRLETEREDLFDSILEITSLLSKNGIDAEAVSFSDRFEVTLYIGDDEVRLGQCDSYDLKINNLQSIMSGVGDGAYSFDLRNYDEEHRTVTARRID